MKVRSFFLMSTFAVVLESFATTHGLVTSQSSEPAVEFSPYYLLSHVGPILGETKGHSIRFFNIPYADPPVADLRWRPPQGMPSWTHVRDATSPGPHCPQKRHRQAAREDCLTLNIFSPTPKSQELKPVLVWIHGGSYNTGTGSHYSSRNIDNPAERLDGTLWNREGVILVTLNYRVGALGFFAHEALDLSEGANFGLLDIVAALRWVKRNIDSFGGDQKRVTIIGGSAGGHAVQSLMVMPQAKGLFWAAVSQSGYGTTPLPRIKRVTRLSGSLSAEGVAQKIIQRATQGPSEGITVEELRALTTDQLVDAVDGYHYPIVDGITLLEEPAILFDHGDQHAVPYISGASSFSGSGFKSQRGLSADALFAITSPFADSVGALYGVESFNKDSQEFKQFFGDQRYVFGSFYTAKQMRKVRRDGYLYLLNYIPPAQRNHWRGAPHSWQKRPLFRDEHIPVINAMRRYIVNFAKTGNPNGAGMPHWPSLRSSHVPWMIFGDEPDVSSDIWPQKLDLLERMYHDRVGELLR